MKHEQSFADMFNKYMEIQAKDKGYRYQSFSVDGQDRDVGGDYVISDSNRFALVEFKDSATDVFHENRKLRRLNLCKDLEVDTDMRQLHDRCHFISWIGATNIYRNEVCNESVFKNDGLETKSAEHATRVTASVFANEFFQSSGTRSLSLEEFEEYIEWVMTKTSESTEKTLELITLDISSQELIIVRLPSIADAYTWMQAHRPKPTPQSSPSSGGPRP